MKIIKTTAAAVLLIAGMYCLSGFKRDGFVISGHLEGPISGKIYLFYEYNRQETRDSVTINDHKFRFTGSVPEPVSGYLIFPNGDQLSLFIENSEIKVSGSSDKPGSATIQGSAAQDTWQAFQKNMEPLDAVTNRFYLFSDSVYRVHHYNKADPEAAALIKAEQNILVDRDFQLLRAFFDQHPQSVICAFALVMHHNVPYLRSYSVAPLFDPLSSEVKASYYGRQMQAILAVEANSSPGSIPSIVMNNIKGKSVKLSSYRGNYVLVDFWASWCVPCRKQSAALLAAYKKYHAKGFDILGVSLDTEKSAWTKAIQSDGLVWEQVSDLREWDKSTAVADFGIDAVPSNFLVDKNGKVIEKNLSIHDLDKKLGEIFYSSKK